MLAREKPIIALHLPLLLPLCQPLGFAAPADPQDARRQFQRISILLRGYNNVFIGKRTVWRERVRELSLSRTNGKRERERERERERSESSKSLAGIVRCRPSIKAERRMKKFPFSPLSAFRDDERDERQTRRRRRRRWRENNTSASRANFIVAADRILIDCDNERPAILRQQ